MRMLVLSISFVLLMTGPALCDVVVYNDRGSFLAAISGAVTVNFDAVDTTAGRVLITGNEFPPLVFSSPVPGDDGKLWVEPPDWYYPGSNFLSPGNPPFLGGSSEHDDLAIDVLGNWRAFGFLAVDNSGGSPESVEFIGDSGSIALLPALPSFPNWFVGIISDQAIRRVVIDELPYDADDVGYDDFILGNPSAVPEPATGVLLGGALAVLVAVRRRSSASRCETRRRRCPS